MSNLTGTTPYNVSTNYLFIPTQISGCALWLDGADPATVLRTGSSVTQWNDKSGNNYNASAFGTPTYVNSVANNLPAIRFNGTSTYFSIPGNQLDITTEDFAIFSVVQYTTKSTQLPIIGKATGASATQQWRLAFDPLNLFQIVVFKNSAFVLSQATYTTPGWTLFGGVAYRATSIQGFINGTGLTAGGALTGTLTDTVTNVEIGRGWSGTQYFNSDMGEILLYKGTITTTQRQQIEGYLAWKWGTQRSLPTTHPYYNNAYLSNSYPISYFPPRLNPTSVVPTVPGFTILTTITQYVFNPRSISGNALWLDAADSATVLRTGNTVTRWDDKSGNGYNASSNSNYGTTTLPTYSSNTTNKYVQMADTQALCTATYNYTTSWSCFVCMNSVSIGARWLISPYVTVNNVLMGMNQGTNKIFTSGFNTVPADITGNHIEYTSAENTNAISNLLWFRDGTIQASNVKSLGVVANASAKMGIGANATFSDAMAGTYQLYEVLIYNRYLTLGQRQQVEGYLAWKWGLQSNLPANHPFKLFPP